MRQYIVKQLNTYDDCDWAKIEKAPIDIYKWGGEDNYSPLSYAQLVLVKNFGFIAHLVSYEKDPMALRTEFYGSVWCDSCLEFFGAIDSNSDYYFNCEMNSHGVCHIGFGKDRYVRKKITDFIDKPFDIRSTIREDNWSATAFISFEDIEKIFSIKKEKLVSGYKFRGNFYKCGDETKYPHFGMWSEITGNDDFHQPQFFGDIIIGE